MNELAYKKTVTTEVEVTINKLSGLLKEIGFGILTRIDFDQKIKEKLNQNLNKTVILGVCHPELAYEAYKQNSDVVLLIPCNIVLTQKNANECKVEFTKPSQMINFLPNVNIKDILTKVEVDILAMLKKL